MTPHQYDTSHAMARQKGSIEQTNTLLKLMHESRLGEF